MVIKKLLVGLFLCSSVYSFAAELKNRRQPVRKTQEKEQRATDESTIAGYINYLPDEIIILIANISDDDGVVALKESCSRFYKLYTKMPDINKRKFTFADNFYDEIKVLPIGNFQPTTALKIQKLTPEQTKILIKYFKKFPPYFKGLDHSRETPWYYHGEAKDIKYVLFFCTLLKNKNLHNSEHNLYSKSVGMLKSAANPCTNALPGSAGVPLAILGAGYLTYQVNNLLGGGVPGFCAGAVCFGVSAPALIFATCYYGLRYELANRSDVEASTIDSFLNELMNNVTEVVVEEESDGSEEEDEST